MTLTKALTSALLLTLLSAPTASAKERILLLRENQQFTLLSDSFTLKLLKIRGYSVEARIMGTKQKLKLGAVITPKDASCTLTFDEISTETKIARFSTTCP